MSLKEEALSLDDQTAITNDNVMVKISTVLYYKITDPVKAAY
jgi:regulator of protease activity HflC (stomatin/prohibitin superfamily)